MSNDNKKPVDQIAVKAIQTRRQRGKGFVSEDTRRFLDGTVVRVSYKEAGEEIYDHVYFEGEPSLQNARVLETPDDVINLINDNKKHVSVVE